MYKTAIIGNAHSGKTSVSSFLMDFFEEKFNEIDKSYKDIYTLKFAEPMKCYDEYIRDNIECTLPKQRRFYQELGDLTKKYYGKKVFAEIFETTTKEIEEDFDNVGLILSDDCRIPFEFDSCKKLDYISIFVDCDKEVRKERAKKDGVDYSPDHNSENEVYLLRDRCDYIITNNGDNLLDLKRDVEVIFNDIVGN